MGEIVKVLEKHQVQLMKDTALLDKMYELNLTYFKELSMYILAGKKKLAEVRSTQLAELTAKAQASGLPRMHRRPKIWTPCAAGLKKRSTIWN